jgi:hypothetical protein
MGLYPCNLPVRKLISLFESSVIPNRQSWTSIHGALSSIHFFRRFRLFKKMNSRFVATVGNKIRRFLKTQAAQCAAHIDIPRPGRVPRLFAQFVCHSSN